MHRGIRFTRITKVRRELIILSLILAAALYLSLVPVDHVAGGLDLCLIKALTHRNCPGCGMTRAISCVLHGEIDRALEHHPLVIVVFPALCALFLKRAYNLYQNIKEENYSVGNKSKKGEQHVLQ